MPKISPLHVKPMLQNWSQKVQTTMHDKWQRIRSAAMRLSLKTQQSQVIKVRYDGKKIRVKK